MMAPSGAGRSPASKLRKLAAVAIAAVFRTGFSASKCKTEVRMATARLKLIRNKREAQLRQLRRDVAELLAAGRDDTARIRVEHVIRERNVMAANEIIELFCELVVTHLPIIAKYRDCPEDMKEGISSLIYAAPRCSDIPELGRMRDIFEKKYGKEFVSAATELRPNSSVNCLLVEKLAVKKPTGEVKLKALKEIAKDHGITWDPSQTEQELLKPPDELLKGPQTVSESVGFNMKAAQAPAPLLQQPVPPKSTGLGHEYDSTNVKAGADVGTFKDAATAAEAAAVSAANAVLAAKAAAYLATKEQSSHSADHTEELKRGNFLGSQSFNLERTNGDDDGSSMGDVDHRAVRRRNSCAARRTATDSGIKFDHSDGSDSDSDGHRSEGGVKGNYELRVHPKMPPDYETLAARFEELRSRKQ